MVEFLSGSIMKQITIKTGKVEMLVVDLPEGATYAGIVRDHFYYYTSLMIPNEDYPYSELIPEGWEGSEFVGKATGLTEEDWNSIVDWNDEKQYYRLYPSKEWQGDITATESGLSLLKANGVVFDMPKKPHWITKINSAEDRDLSQKQMEDYFAAESKVWRNCHVFIKIDQDEK